MLLFYVFCVLFGGSSAEIVYETRCYGTHFNLPLSYTPPIFNGKLYFTPNHGLRKLLMEKGESKDPRLQVSIGSVVFTDLTEGDEGTFSISHGGKRRTTVIALTVTDCATNVYKYYGDIFSCDVPGEAEFLEFIPRHSEDQLMVLWNRTDNELNKGGRGQIKRNVWEMKDVVQSDGGYYNFRAKDRTVLSRISLEVREHYRVYDTKENKRLIIRYPSNAKRWTVVFKSERKEESHTLMHVGDLILSDWSSPFADRIQALYSGLLIDPVKITDHGTYEFRDPKGNLAQRAYVAVTPDAHGTFVYVGIGVGVVFAAIACCCCVRKCCCKKSSSKRNGSAPPAAPAVYYHDMDEPAGPRYAAAPATATSRECAAISLGPWANSPVNFHVNPPQPEVAPLGGHGVDPPLAPGSDWLSSHPEPTFELKGLPSAPPLSSDSNFSHVYTSDKLDFISTEGPI